MIKDFIKIRQLINRYNISKLYHFTDYENIKSIVQNGGLFSYGDCIQKGIRISRPGGSELSRELDEQEHLQHYVRISFCKRHPMMYSAIQDGRISKPVILEIDKDVLYIDGCIYADKNAVRADSTKGTSFESLANIHFKTVAKDSQFDVSEDEQEFYQAEVLVPHFIPLQYILNISNFYKQDSSLINQNVSELYTAHITKDNPTCALFIVNQSSPTCKEVLFEERMTPKTEVVSEIINRVIRSTISANYNNENDGKSIYFDAIGYGDYAYSLWGNKGFLSMQEIAKSSNDHLWIKPRSEGGANLFMALRMAIKKIEKWIAMYPDSYPPSIIHITEYRYHGADDSMMVQLANELKYLSTNNGNVLFFNIIITADDKKSLFFPSNRNKLTESYYGDMYYLLSSSLPLSYKRQLSNYLPSPPPAESLRAFACYVPYDKLENLIGSIVPNV